MALLNKLGEIVKSAAEKTEELTKTLGEKAEAALEIQRLNSQVNKERSKISDTHKKIGEILWAKFEAGEEIPEEFKEHCTAISEALTKIEIIVPAECLENNDYIEFVSNPDGKISISIKNIGKILNR